MDSLDQLLAAQAGGGSTAQPAAPSSAPAADPLDSLLSARAQGQEIPASAAGGSGAAAPQTAAGQLVRQLGLTARAGVTGITALPAMIGDALNTGVNYASHGVNALAGTHIPDIQMPSQVIQKGENAVGLPQPKGTLENLVQSGASSMAGVGPGVAIGRALAGTSAPVAQAVGQGLQAAPGMQMLGAAGSGIAGSGAAAAGAGPIGQIGAALAGGALGVLGGSGATAAVRGASSIPDAVVNARQPVTNPTGYVGRFLKNGATDADAAAQATADPQILVPGSMPRTSQVAGDPYVVQLEKAFANHNGDFKTAIAQNDIANNQARWTSLNSVAGTPEDLDAAITARRTAMAPMVDAVLTKGAPVPVQPILDHVNALQASSFGTDPVIAKGLSDVKAALLARATQEGGTPATPSTILGANGRPISTTPGTPAGPLTIAPDLADGIRQNLSSFIADNSSNGAVSSKQEAGLLPLKSTITDAISSTNPQYPAYLSEYAKQSVPINTMQAGQNIVNSLAGKTVDASGTPLLTLTNYSGQLAKALKSSEYGIDPVAQQKLQNIQDDLQRATAANSMKSPGSDTAYNLTSKGWLAKSLYGDEYQGGGLGKALGRGLGGAGAIGGATLFGPAGAGVGGYLGQALGNKLSGLGQNVGGNLESTLAGALMDPNKFNQALGLALKNR